MSYLGIIFTIATVIIVGLLAILYFGIVRKIRSPFIGTNYFQLRNEFLREVINAGGEIISKPIAARGPDGEGLAVDVGWFGAKTPSKVLLHISGTHGVEGYLGSAIQTKIIKGGVGALEEDAAIVFVHGLNPWGMAHLRRVNESNVDLNRNFFLHSDSFEISSPSYQALNSFLNPNGAPSRIDTFYFSAIIKIIRLGLQNLKQSIAGGQYEFEKGIYFGGKKLEQSCLLLKQFIEAHFSSVRELYAIEVHSGLGPWGEHTLFWPLSKDNPKTQKLAAALGEQLSFNESAGIGFTTPGDLQNEIPKLLPNTSTYWLLQEFGAYGPLKTLRALRDENRYVNAGGQDLGHWSKQIFLERFVPGDANWQKTVLQSGTTLFTKVKNML